MAKAKNVEVALNNAEVSEWHEAKPNPTAKAAPEGMFYRVERGENSETGKINYRCELKDGPDGEAVVSKIIGSTPAACKNACEAFGLAKDALIFETSLKVLFPTPTKGDNNPPEPTLDADQIASAETATRAIDEALNDLESKEEDARAAELETANAIRALRFDLAADKKVWAAIKKDVLPNIKDVSGDTIKTLMENQNYVGFMVKMSRMADHAALWDTLPATYRTGRSIEKVTGQVRVAIAGAVVKAIIEDAEFESMSDNAAIMRLLGDYADGEGVDVDVALQPFAAAMAQAHLDNLERHVDDVDMLTTEKNKDGIFVTKPSVGDGTAPTLFGIEGGDEMVKAIATAFNSYESAKSVSVAASEDSAEGVKELEKVIRKGNAFSAMSTDDAARHLLHILSSKLDDDDRAATGEGVKAVIAVMASKLDQWENGELDKVDLYAVAEADAPESAEDAEAAADAA